MHPSALTTVAGDLTTKLCPFNPNSDVCTSSLCYFYRISDTNERLCPHSDCDSLITTYCTPSQSDFGCKVMTRPPFYATSYSAEPNRPPYVGVGPYTDWLEDKPVGISWWMEESARKASATEQSPLAYVVKDGMGGGMSTEELTCEMSTTSFAASRSSFIEDIASTLAVDTDSVFISSESVSASSTTVVVQIVGPALSSTQINTIRSTATLGSIGVVSLTTSRVVRTNLCYGEPYPKTGCTKDPIEEALTLCPGKECMSEVYSYPAEDLASGMASEPFGDIVTVGVMVTLIVAGAFAVFSAALTYERLWIVAASTWVFMFFIIAIGS